jgi:hypothetical protein
LRFLKPNNLRSEDQIETFLCSLAIPMNLATQSEGIWPGVPIERGHLIRSMLAPPSERSDAGVF